MCLLCLLRLKHTQPQIKKPCPFDKVFCVHKSPLGLITIVVGFKGTCYCNANIIGLIFRELFQFNP